MKENVGKGKNDLTYFYRKQSRQKRGGFRASTDIGNKQLQVKDRTKREKSRVKSRKYPFLGRKRLETRGCSFDNKKGGGK